MGILAKTVALGADIKISDGKECKRCKDPVTGF
jgi:hypothetical protein